MAVLLGLLSSQQLSCGGKGYDRIGGEGGGGGGGDAGGAGPPLDASIDPDAGTGTGGMLEATGGTGTGGALLGGTSGGGGSGGNSSGGQIGTGGTLPGSTGGTSTTGTGGASSGGQSGSGGTVGSGGRTGSGGVAGVAGGIAAGGGSAGKAGAQGTGGASMGGVPAAGRIISVDFVGSAPAPMAPAEIAGFKPAANWNSAAGTTGSLLSLVDQTGVVVPGLSVTWSSSMEFMQWTADQPGHSRMFNGYLDPIGAPAMITVRGIPAAAVAARFDVYLYAMGSIPGLNDDRSSTYAIGSVQVGLTERSPSPRTAADLPTYMKATGGFGNYVQFPAIPVSIFTIVATPGMGIQPRAPVNGFQIVLPPGT